MKKICELCNNEFETNNPKQEKYCSPKCKLKVRAIQATKRKTNRRKLQYEQTKHHTCPVCLCEFDREYGKKQTYCSSKCRRQAERIFGDKQQRDLNYKDQIRFGGNKYRVLQRDEYECKMCGNKTQLVIHHKECSGKSEQINNNMDNLVTLCRKCHINIHRL